MRELRARADCGAAAAGSGAGGGDRGGRCDPAAGATADLSGRVRLSVVRATGGVARTRPVHPCARRRTDRPGVPLHRLAVSELPVWPAVHALQLRDRTAGTRGRALGAQDDRRRIEPRRGGSDRASSRATRPVGAVGRRFRGAEPGDAGARRGWRPQRHVADPGARGGAVADRGNRRDSGRGGPISEGGRRRAGRGRGHQADGRTGPPLPDSRVVEHTRACTGGARRGRGTVGPGRAGGDRLRRARIRLSGRDRRAAAARLHPQRPRRDGPPGGFERDAGLVARSVRGRLPDRAGRRAVAHDARRRLARSGWLEHDRIAGVHGVGAAVVCDLGAAASCCQRQSAPARRHARRLRVRHSDPPDAG